MKSTGEVMGIDHNFRGALTKALSAAFLTIPPNSSVLLSIADRDIDSLCEHLVSTRFQGQLTTEQAENEQSLTLLLSIRNH